MGMGSNRGWKWNRFGAVALTGLIAVGSTASGARAQVAVPAGVLELEDAEIFRPTTDGGAYVTVYDSETLPAARGHLSFYGDYALNPLEVQFERSEEPFTRVVRNLGTMQLSGAYGLLDGVTVGARVPGYVTGTNRLNTPSGRFGGTDGNLGDVVANVKVRALDPRRFGLGVAILPEVTLPTGNGREFAGTGELGYGGHLVLDGEVTGSTRLGLNFGGVIRDEPGGGPPSDADDEYEDQFRFGAALHQQLTDRLSGIAEIYGAADTSDPFDEERKTPVDFVGAIRSTFGRFHVTLGGGAGLTRGRGSPDFRVFAGVGMTRPGPEPPPEIGPDLAESTKAYALADQDGDGRPSPGDVLEYRIHLVNTGGAPGTNVVVEDVIPDGTAYVEGSLQVNGRPATDPVDGDAAEYVPPTVRFRLPRIDVTPGGESGAMVSFQVQVDPNITELVTVENRATVSSSEIERFPLAPARTTVFPQIAQREHVIVSPDKLELTEEIHFEFDKTVIQRESFPILNELADVLREYPLLRVRIEGHTDSVGDTSYNQKLSERRALAVRDYLVGAGIEADRLSWAGYGESRPIASNDTAAGRAKNRRTEFPILNPEALRERNLEMVPGPQRDLAPQSEPEWLKRGGQPPR